MSGPRYIWPTPRHLSPQASPFAELVSGVNQTQAILLSIFPSLGGECEVGTWPHSLCAHLRQVSEQ